MFDGEGLRLGITTRVVDAQAYDEPRDALAQDWGRFMAAVLPRAAWMPVPNVGGEAVRLAEAWGLNGLILSGGDEVGEPPSRDATERALIAWAFERGVPVFGVCRGLQLLAVLAGSVLSPCPDGAHVATEHEVTLEPSAWFGLTEPRTVTVNSYHNVCLAETDVGDDLIVLARTGATVEALTDRARRFLAVLWHPERFDADPRPPDRTLFQNFWEAHRP